MRAAPPLQVKVVRFGIWKAAVGLLITTAAVTIGSWIVAGIADRPAVASAAAGALAVCLLAAAASSLPVAARRLRWDGERWYVAFATADAGALLDEPWSGRVDVAIDLGAWLLLKFTAESGPVPRPHRCPHRWLPVQRRGLEGPWHALRATLYSARPAASGQATAVRQDPAE